MHSKANVVDVQRMQAEFNNSRSGGVTLGRYMENGSHIDDQQESQEFQLMNNAAIPPTHSKRKRNRSAGVVHHHHQNNSYSMENTAHNSPLAKNAHLGCA